MHLIYEKDLFRKLFTCGRHDILQGQRTGVENWENNVRMATCYNLPNTKSGHVLYFTTSILVHII